MLPTRINLLSPEKQKALHHLVHLQFLKNIFEVVLFLSCVTSIILIGAEWVLTSYFGSIAANVKVSSKQVASINTDINRINVATEVARLIQEEYTQWSVLTTELYRQIPTGVTLKSTSMNMKDAVIVLTGEALTRDALLALQENLRSIPWVLEVVLPLSQLTEKTNIPFSIELKTQ